MLDKNYRHKKVNGTTKPEFYNDKRLEDLTDIPIGSILGIFSNDISSVLRAAVDSGLTVDVCWWGERIDTHEIPKVKYNGAWVDMPLDLVADFDREGKYRRQEQVTPCSECASAHKRKIEDMRRTYGTTRHTEQVIEDAA